MRPGAARTLLALALLCLAHAAAFGQGPARVYRLGILSPSVGTIDRMRAAALPELARLGFVEGRNLSIEARSGSPEEFPAIASDLLAAHPDVVLAAGNAAIIALRQQSETTPIVGSFIGDDPIAAGFAKSLAHPGGNVTGIFMLASELDAKRLDLLHELVPQARHVAVLAVNARRGEASIAATEEVGRRESLDVAPFFAAAPQDYAPALARMRSAGIEALLITSAPEFFTDARLLAALAIQAGLPTMCEWRSMAVAGCLVGYGPDFGELDRRIATYAARIFHGAVPAELPIEGPTHFEFAVNLKTAKALGLTVPPSILVRADEVIE